MTAHAATHEPAAARTGGVEDEALILRRARVWPEAFAPLHEHYGDRIYEYCLRRVDRPEEAEDLTSLIFSRALAGLGRYRGGSLAAWLFTIAHHAVANHLRGRRPYLSLEGSALAAALNLPEPDADPLDRMARSEERQRVARLVAALPEDQRALLALKLGNLSAKEIGAVVGKREGAVRVALFRLGQQLRAAYQRGEPERRV